MRHLRSITVLLASAAVITPAYASANEEESQPADEGIQDIVVTATRQSETISKVPISITAYDQKALDAQNVRRIDDISRIATGITFVRSAGGNGNQTNIAIRGISSTIGASTTGIYINEAPIQVRMIGVTAAPAYPLIFDLERVEVLRGPQGTLFGASAQGGTIRFITPRPDLHNTSIYARSEVSFIESGSPNYEGGIAVGAPLVSDNLAIRASAWYRHDGGWVDRVGPLLETGYDATKIQKNINQQNAQAYKVDLLWQPSPFISIIPSIYHQKVDAKDISQIFKNTSDPDTLDYNTPNQIPLPSTQRFTLASLNANIEIGGVDLISNTSYFRSNLDQIFDYTYQSAELNSTLVPYITIPGQNETAVHFDTQKTFTQEVRLQSKPGNVFNWVVGAFYSRSKQTSSQDIISPYIDALIKQATGGAGSLIDFFGAPLMEGDVFFRGVTTSVDEQLAAFAQADLNVTEKLKLTAGVRVSRTTFEAEIMGDGPLNGGYDLTRANQKEHPITPKFGVSYQANPSLLLYASAAKGFRPGASQPPENSIRCVPDLEALGWDKSPTEYKADTLWSYEVGVKNRVGNFLNIDASAYVIKWNDMQQRIILPTCGSAVIVNLGKVTSRGLDLALSAKVTRNLTISSAIGYNQVSFDETVYSVPPRIVRTKGSELSTVPFTFSVSGQYDVPLSPSADGYIRVDYQRGDASPRGLHTDFGYDPLNDPLPESNNLDLRVGARLRGLDVSIFASNVLNDRPMQYFHASANSVLFRANAPRPRTIGLTANYRY